MTSNNTIRCHSNILKYAWSRLWYFFRSKDPNGRGLLTVPWLEIKQTFNCGNSTIWNWLKVGKICGAYIYYKKVGEYLQVRLGSRDRICRTLELDSWGETVIVDFSQLIKLETARAIRTVATIGQKQNSSRYAARQKLPKAVRKTTKIPTAYEVFDQIKKIDGLIESGSRATVTSLLGWSDRKIWVSKGFIAFGCSQDSVATELWLHPFTIRRHCSRLNIDRRQLIQAKSEYKKIKLAYVWGGGINNDSYITFDDQIGWSTAYQELAVNHKRFFKYGGRYWLAKCCLYDIPFERKSERTARKKYKRSLSLEKNRAAEGIDKSQLNKLINESNCLDSPFDSLGGI